MSMELRLSLLEVRVTLIRVDDPVVASGIVAAEERVVEGDYRGGAVIDLLDSGDGEVDEFGGGRLELFENVGLQRQDRISPPAVGDFEVIAACARAARQHARPVLRKLTAWCQLQTACRAMPFHLFGP